MSRPLQPLNPASVVPAIRLARKLLDGFPLADAPDVGDTDIAFAFADADVTPALPAFFDAADDARFRVIADAALAFGLGLDCARLAVLDDGGAAVAEQRHQHPAACAFAVLDHPPIGEGLHHPDREI